ncbi:MAG TPA: hypothetical protein VJR94_07810 [Candidatus Nitrosocosmicus sp.]|nr:hypothetical protein [Candidatus Nitrosocosmicus sp.]
MILFTLKKSLVISLVGIFLAISLSINPIDLTFAYVEFDVSGNGDPASASTPTPYGSQDRLMTHSQSSSQGSYCYAPPNATIINSCNSGDFSSSYDSGYNMFGQ